MKYYIDGNLVRTSDRIYTHAVMWDDALISCSGNYELAKKEMDRRIAERESRIRECKLAIKAIDEGKTYYMAKICRKTCKVRVNGTREDYENSIAFNENSITRYHIRELEAR